MGTWNQASSTLVRFKISTDGLHMIFRAHRWLIQRIMYVIASNDPSSKCKTTRLGSTWSRKLCWIFLAPPSTADPLTPFNWYSCITTHSRRISEVTSRVSINFENHQVFAGWNICPKERFKFNRKSKKHVKCILIKLREIPENSGKMAPKSNPPTRLKITSLFAFRHLRDPSQHQEEKGPNGPTKTNESNASQYLRSTLQGTNMSSHPGEKNKNLQTVWEGNMFEDFSGSCKEW